MEFFNSTDRPKPQNHSKFFTFSPPTMWKGAIECQMSPLWGHNMSQCTVFALCLSPRATCTTEDWKICSFLLKTNSHYTPSPLSPPLLPTRNSRVQHHVPYPGTRSFSRAMWSLIPALWSILPASSRHLKSRPPSCPIQCQGDNILAAQYSLGHPVLLYTRLCSLVSFKNNMCSLSDIFLLLSLACQVSGKWWS